LAVTNQLGFPAVDCEFNIGNGIGELSTISIGHFVYFYGLNGIIFIIDYFQFLKFPTFQTPNNFDVRRWMRPFRYIGTYRGEQFYKKNTVVYTVKKSIDFLDAIITGRSLL
jgi:hypothetical protein